MESTPFNVNLTMGEMYLCMSIWFDNMYEKPTFLPLATKESEGEKGTKYASEVELKNAIESELGKDSTKDGKNRVGSSKDKSAEVSTALLFFSIPTKFLETIFYCCTFY